MLLDTNYGDPGETRHHECAWIVLATLAERVLDGGFNWWAQRSWPV